MVLVCGGDVEPVKMISEMERMTQPQPKEKAEVLLPLEEERVKKNYTWMEMDISKPIFHLGFKHRFTKESVKAKRIYGMKLLLDLIGGNSSDFYCQLYQEGLVDEELGFDYIFGNGYCASIISGGAREPKIVAKKIKERINALKKNGVAQEDFQRLKKKHLGRFIRGFNSIDAICMSQLDLAVTGQDLFDGFEAIKGLKKSDLETILEEEFLVENSVLSVISAR